MGKILISLNPNGPRLRRILRFILIILTPIRKELTR